MFISVLGRYVPSSKLGIILYISTQTFWGVVTTSLDSCAEIKSAFQWHNSSVGVTSSGRVWRKMPESDARSVTFTVSARLVCRYLSGRASECCLFTADPDARRSGCLCECVSFCCLTSTEARSPIRDGDEWEKGDRRVKPRNRRQPRRLQGCRGPPPEQQNVKAVSVRRCTATTAPRNCCPNCYAEQSHKDNVRSSAVGKQLKRKKSNSQDQLHLPALDLFWANL